MNDMNTWPHELRTTIPNFLNALKGKKRPGFYRYSLSGDYVPESVKWGLGNSAFFLKIAYTLGLENTHEQDIQDAAGFILSFENAQGEFCDRTLSLLSLPWRSYDFVKSRNRSTLFYQNVKRAETRQALSSLRLFHINGKHPYRDFPQNESEVLKFLQRLNWHQPWGAGSHFSHVLFFLKNSDHPNKEALIDSAIYWVNQLQQKTDGCWYRGTPTIQQKINGAMKIITGLAAAGRTQFPRAQTLADTALASTNDSQACDNFNITYVLKNCDAVLGHQYRRSEMTEFMQNRLALYRKFYYPEIGGFSFHPRSANRMYYWAPISRGKDEPDIHGTVMFVWGISLISQFLGINKELGFREFLT